MHHSPISSFRRILDAAQLEARSQAEASPDQSSVDKWEVLRKLSIARARFGLSHRDLNVLQALISFHPGKDLTMGSDTIVVHPANKTICERLNGMPCSTMRRHLAKLVDAALIRRKDSPNGKRYTRRFAGQKIAFGFDLSPLVTRFDEIQAKAEAQIEENAAYAQLRDAVSLLRRDLRELAQYGQSLHPDLPHWDRISDELALTARQLRRKLPKADLTAIHSVLKTSLQGLTTLLKISKPEEMSTTNAQNEQHQQRSNKEIYDSKIAERTAKQDRKPKLQCPSLPLGTILEACPEIESYSTEKIRGWRDFVALTERLYPMVAIPASLWQDMRSAMGAENAATAFAVILQKGSIIQSPPAYLRHLCKKAKSGEFHPDRMIRALLQQRENDQFTTVNSC